MNFWKLSRAIPVRRAINAVPTLELLVIRIGDLADRLDGFCGKSCCNNNERNNRDNRNGNSDLNQHLTFLKIWFVLHHMYHRAQLILICSIVGGVSPPVNAPQSIPVGSGRAQSSLL